MAGAADEPVLGCHVSPTQVRVYQLPVGVDGLASRQPSLGDEEAEGKEQRQEKESIEGNGKSKQELRQKEKKQVVKRRVAMNIEQGAGRNVSC